MAGMEQLEIHSKSYLVRWIHVSAGHTISWSVKPHKKSINFGIFKHPGTNNGHTPNLPSSAMLDSLNASSIAESSSRSRSVPLGGSKNDRTLVVEKLQSIGLKPVAWTGKCEADKITMGKYDVGEGEGGMYGLVFDNTFSKQVSKTATFVLMTYPTNAPPKSGHSLMFSQAVPGGSTPTLQARASPSMAPVGSSTDSLPQDFSASKTVLTAPRPKSSHPSELKDASGATFYTGILHKKRRKRNQGYARRFFSLDFTTSTLSYYRNDHSSALRGAIPLSLAAIGANEKTREISVDSGAEVWQLRAINKKDFTDWKDALERASRSAGLTSPVDVERREATWHQSPAEVNPAEEREWARVEALVGRVAGTRDAVRRLAQDTDPKYQSALAGLALNKIGESASASPTDSESLDYFKEEDKTEKTEKSSFWKRKQAPNPGSSPAALFRRSVSAQLAVPSPTAIPPLPSLPNGTLAVPKTRGRLDAPTEDSIHENCMALLADLDSVVSEFSALLNESRQRRIPPILAAAPRKSTESMSSDEFFDAQDGEASRSQLLTIRRDSTESVERVDVESDGGSESSSEGDTGSAQFNPKFTEEDTGLFPAKPKSLIPLPLDAVKRRNIIPAPKVSPPSLIGLLRKNAGKDLSTVAMPVSTNEPISLLQRFGEQMEYSELLDKACAANSETGERILYIMAFAISNFSNSRVKERAIRKPFNPMLGETFELVREDKGFRFLAEKVCHRPVRLATQAESQHWTFLQSPMPVQKFWGKSAELNTDGRARVFLHSTNEHFSWVCATSYLRNIIAGEKYVEPYGTMTVVDEKTGAKAVATFKAGGMFAGRSEDLTVEAFDARGSALALGLTGKWTNQLNLTNRGSDTGKAIWSVGALVDDAARRYGFTTFAASLNEVTPVEQNKLPVTDSRLRPDQRAHEQGDLDTAEDLKAKLEEKQRARRKVMEESGEVWTPRWFVKVSEPDETEEIWKLKTGKDGYWEERAKEEWTDVLDVFQP